MTEAQARKLGYDERQYSWPETTQAAEFQDEKLNGAYREGAEAYDREKEAACFTMSL